MQGRARSGTAGAGGARTGLPRPADPGADHRDPAHGPSRDGTAVGTTHPDLAATARRQGVHSTISLGAPVPQRVLGGIDVYRSGDEPLDEHAVRLLRTSASYAAASLAADVVTRAARG